jgi:hypothetical protein
MSISKRTGSHNPTRSKNRDLGWFTDRHALIRRFTEYVNSSAEYINSSPPPEQILYFYGA